MRFRTPSEALEVYLGCPYLDTHAHLTFLRDSAHGDVLEIGTYTGISTAALLAGVELRGGHVYSVDVSPGAAFAWHQHPQWTFTCAYSNARQTIDPKIPALFDLVFVDGGHNYQDVHYDLFHYGGRLKSGGMLLAHDTNISFFPGVKQAAKEFAGSTGWPVEWREASCGLAVFKKP